MTLINYYKITNNQTMDFYVGSTHHLLCARMARHRYSAGKMQSQAPIHCLMRQLGADKFKIVLLSSHDHTPTERKKHERSLIDQLTPSLNLTLPYKTAEEKRVAINENQRNYMRKRRAAARLTQQTAQTAQTTQS